MIAFANKAGLKEDHTKRIAKKYSWVTNAPHDLMDKLFGA